jgi:hypothetical protein
MSCRSRTPSTHVAAAARAGLAALLVALAGCGAGRPTPAGDEPRVRALLEDAGLVTDEFRQRLGGALTTAIRKGGFADAIDTCAKAAPAIAESLARPDRRVYRVGTRVRNPRLGAPDVVDRRLLDRLARAPGEPAWELERDGRGQATGLRVARGIPIRADMCLKCHGGPDDLAPGVPGALAAGYPADQAVGYRLGDLRGAFVVRYTLK